MVLARMIIVLLVLAAWPGLSGCAKTQPASNPRYGVSPGADILWLPAEEMERELDLYQRMGFGWIRLDIDWHSIEEVRGNFDWEGPDRVVQAARERGLRVLAMPAYTPPWAATVNGDAHSEPSDMADFARFVGQAVDRYRPMGVHDWEIWNEPNSSLFWLPRPDARRYTQMLELTSREIRQRDPEATIVAGALAPAFDARNRSQVSPLTYVRRLYAAGAAPHFDVLSVHPYTYPLSPTDPGSTWFAGFNLRRIHAEMARLGDAKPMWITEFGAPTGSDPQAVSEVRQADILNGVLEQHPAWVEKVFLYGGRDRGSDASDREQNFGFVRQDFSDKVSRENIQDTLLESADSHNG